MSVWKEKGFANSTDGKCVGVWDFGEGELDAWMEFQSSCNSFQKKQFPHSEGFEEDLFRRLLMILPWVNFVPTGGDMSICLLFSLQAKYSTELGAKGHVVGWVCIGQKVIEKKIGVVFGAKGKHLLFEQWFCMVNHCWGSTSKTFGKTKSQCVACPVIFFKSIDSPCSMFFGAPRRWGSDVSRRNS